MRFHDILNIFQGVTTLLDSPWPILLGRVGFIFLGMLLVYLGQKGVLEPLLMIPMGLGMCAVNAGVLFLDPTTGAAVTEAPVASDALTHGTLFMVPLVQKTNNLMYIAQVDFLQPSTPLRSVMASSPASSSWASGCCSMSVFCWLGPFSVCFWPCLPNWAPSRPFRSRWRWASTIAKPPRSRWWEARMAPNAFEAPGRPARRTSDRGLGTLNRIDPVFLNLQKTRLHDPLLGFWLGGLIEAAGARCRR